MNLKARLERLELARSRAVCDFTIVRRIIPGGEAFVTEIRGGRIVRLREAMPYDEAAKLAREQSRSSAVTAVTTPPRSDDLPPPHARGNTKGNTEQACA
jgi:hypothetical protein